MRNNAIVLRYASLTLSDFFVTKKRPAKAIAVNTLAPARFAPTVRGKSCASMAIHKGVNTAKSNAMMRTREIIILARRA